MITVNDRTPDVEAIFEFNDERRSPVCDGYRPDHLIKDGYLTTGTHHYFNVKSVPPGGKAMGTITFITPESYPHCLSVGQKLAIQEGNRIVGYAAITKILNPLLSDHYH